jgi:hypothetical protein
MSDKIPVWGKHIEDGKELHFVLSGRDKLVVRIESEGSFKASYEIKKNDVHELGRSNQIEFFGFAEKKVEKNRKIKFSIEKNIEELPCVYGHLIKIDIVTFRNGFRSYGRVVSRGESFAFYLKEFRKMKEEVIALELSDSNRYGLFGLPETYK